jgi:hypothetical protein
MLVGYMRVSSESDRQITDLQRDALLAVGVDGRHLFEDHGSGAKDDRPGLTEALSFVRAGDVLVVWKLDRLGRSLSHLLCIVNTLKEKQVAFRSLTEGMDTTTASGELLFHNIPKSCGVRLTKGKTCLNNGTAPPTSCSSPAAEKWSVIERKTTRSACLLCI